MDYRILRYSCTECTPTPRIFFWSFKFPPIFSYRESYILFFPRGSIQYIIVVSSILFLKVDIRLLQSKIWANMSIKIKIRQSKSNYFEISYSYKNKHILLQFCMKMKKKTLNLSLCFCVKIRLANFLWKLFKIFQKIGSGEEFSQGFFSPLRKIFSRPPLQVYKRQKK